MAKNLRHPLDMPRNPLDEATIESLGDCYSLVVSSDGVCMLNPRAPQTVGSHPWEWCVAEDEKICRDAFVEACMFRKEGISFAARVYAEGRVLRLSFRLYPLDHGQVLCLYTRVFEGELSARERHVLALLAGGATSAQIAKALQISASTARDHVAHIKKKLGIRHKDGYRMAAHYFGLASRPESA